MDSCSRQAYKEEAESDSSSDARIQTQAQEISIVKPSVVHSRQPPAAGAVDPGLAPFLQQIAYVFQQMAKTEPPKMQFHKLRKYGATEFDGRNEDDPSVAECWLERTERVFHMMQCTPEQKYKYAIHLLQEYAYDWWKRVLQKPQTPSSPTWDFFLAEFRAKYIPWIYTYEKKNEFLNLKQQEMTVTEYEIEFTHLSKYAPDVMITEADRCRRFEDGLNYYIRYQVTALQIEEFRRLVTAALRVEMVRQEEQSTKERDSRRPHSALSISKRARKVSERFQTWGSNQTSIYREDHTDNKKSEFLNLKQRGMTVTEYEREFIRLSTYATDIMINEADKCRRFEDGLNYYIRYRVTPLQIEEFPRLVAAALSVERVRREIKFGKDKDFRRSQSSTASSISNRAQTASGRF